LPAEQLNNENLLRHGRILCQDICLRYLAIACLADASSGRIPDPEAGKPESKAYKLPLCAGKSPKLLIQ
jgi:hypothetical protein